MSLYKDNVLTVYRTRKKGLINAALAIVTSYYNLIDVGIYLCILELCLDNKGLSYSRELFVDSTTNKKDTKIAEYKL